MKMRRVWQYKRLGAILGICLIIAIGIFILSSSQGIVEAQGPSVNSSVPCGDTSADVPPDPYSTESTPVLSSISAISSGLYTTSPSSTAKTFRTDSGPELDLYQPCSGGDHLINFYINVHDVDLSAAGSATLTLAVWDVDYDCGTACNGVCERDTVYLNGHRLTTPVPYLTGANNQWSTVTFDINPQWIVDGDNYVEIYIDTLSNGCWCVQCDWGELSIGTEENDLWLESKDISVASPSCTVDFWSQPFSIKATIHNNGIQDAYNVEVKFVKKWSSGTGFGSGLTLKEETKTIGCIPAGGLGLASVNWNLDPNNIVQVIVDPTDKIEEPNEDNNIARTTQSTGIVTDSSGIPLKNVRVTYEKLNMGLWENTNIVVFTDSQGRYFINNNLDQIIDGIESRINSSLEFSPTRDLSDIRFRIYNESEWGDDENKAADAQTYSTSTVPWTMDVGEDYTKNVQYADHSCVLAYKTLVTAYNYWDGLTPSLVPSATIDVEMNNDEKVWTTVLNPNGEWYSTSYQNHNNIHIWQTHGNYPSVIAHEYAHRVSEDWGIIYDPVGENFANYGSCKARDTSLFVMPQTDVPFDAIYDLSKTHPDPWWTGQWLPGFQWVTGSEPNPYLQLAGVFWKLDTNKVYLTLQKGPDTAKQFYDNYGTPDAAIKKIFRQAGIDTSGWLPDGPKDPDIFTDSFSSYLVDTSGNGLADYLNISVGFDIPSAGTYYIYAFLSDATGADYCFASTEESLGAGVQTVNLSFDGRTIFDKRLTGNYTLTSTYIANESMEEIDWRIDAYTTGTSYDYLDFEAPDIFMTDNYADSGTDANGDTFFDYLSIDVELNISTVGDYVVSANLYDSSGNFSVSAVNCSHLNLGPQFVRLNFSGLTIRAHQVNGPYVLRGVYVSDDGDMPLYSNDVLSYTTSSYLYTAFQQPYATFSTPITDAGTDDDVDGLYEYLNLSATTAVTASGDYALDARLYDASGDFITSASNASHLDTGVGLLSVNFDGTLIREHAVDGPYYVVLDLYNSDNTLISIAHHTTSAYSVTAFDMLAEDAFDMTFEDQGTDTGGSSMYDCLTVDVNITSQVKSGDFRFDGYLYDQDGNLVSFTNSSVDVSTSIESTALCFSGQQIWRAKITDGTYNLSLKIYDSDSTLVTELSNVYTTQVYNYSDFEVPAATFSDSYSDSGVDANSDGLYEGLAIEVGIHAEAAGNYTVSGVLSGSVIDGVSDEVNLSAGDNFVSLVFDGNAIYAHGEDGPYSLTELAMYDDYGVLQDYRDVAYNTSSYTYGQFQDPVVLTGNYSESAIDTNGNALYDWLTINVEINVVNGGNYALNARLMDTDDHEISWAENEFWSAPGIHILQLNYDGKGIYRNGVDGPFYVKDIYIYNRDDVSQADYQSEAYTTLSYSYEDFEEDLTVTFPDPGLDAAVRSAVGRPSGHIYQSDLDGLVYLWAGFKGIADLTGIEHCTNLQVLYLNANHINNISCLSALTSLTSLNLESNQIGNNLSIMPSLINLTYLNLGSNNISNISPLSGLTNLQQLYLNGNHISNIHPISGLTSLNYLSLDFNQLSDISALSSLHSLANLNLESNQISDLSALSGLTTLTDLNLWTNQVSNISALSNLKSLTFLNLGGNNISNISPLSSLTNLQQLYLWSNQISNVSALAGLTVLSTLDLGHNLMGSNLSPLSNLSSLSDLRLEDNHIGNISPLSGFTQLETLHLESNQVINISPLSNLTGLVNLYLDNNQVSNLSPLSGLTNLSTLYVSWNEVSNISPLASCTNLQYLWASNNHVSDIPQLLGLTDMKSLDLSYNNISDISALSNLTQLYALYLWNNNISDISALSHLTYLQYLYLASNQISDISPLAGLTITPTPTPTSTPEPTFTPVSTPTPEPTGTLTPTPLPTSTPTPTATPVPAPSGLAYVDLGWNHITDISPLTGITSLRGLSLSGNNISDFSPLSGLSYLNSLSLGYTHMSDITPLCNMTSLRDLYLENNQIANISALSDLINLQYLFLEHNRISDISVLSNLTNLYRLELSSNNISEIVSLVDNTGLGFGDYLDLYCNPLSASSIDSSIPVLEARGVSVGYTDPPNAPDLEWPDNGADVAGLTPALSWHDSGSVANYSLQVATDSDFVTTVLDQANINESYYEIPDGVLSLNTQYYWRVSAFSACGGGSNWSVTWNFTTEEDSIVTFADCNLAQAIRDALVAPTATPTPAPTSTPSPSPTPTPSCDINQSDLDKLTSLAAYNRNITNLSGIEHCYRLRSLNLAGNQVSNISPIASLTRLTWLDLGWNQISNLSPLSGLINLQTLYMSGNHLSDISPLTSITDLRSISLGNNEISNISALSRLTKLQYIYLWNNHVSNLSPLSGLKSLYSIDLSDNQISDLTPLASLGITVSPTPTPSPSPTPGPTPGPTPTPTPVPVSFVYWLDLSGNQISNLSPLVGLTGLSSLYLDENRISNISPLVSNTGLGAGDYVSLYCNPLNNVSANTYVPIIQGRGVSVSYTTILSPSLVSPINGSTGISTIPILHWDSASGASSYKLQLSAQASFSSTMLNLSGITGTSYKVATPLSKHTTYYWRVAGVGCGNTTSSWSGTWQFTTLTNEIVVTFPDPNLETAIRNAVGKPIGDIYQSELDEMTSLWVGWGYVSDLTGLEHCTSLTSLSILGNPIANISALSGLTNITYLDLNWNEIEDLLPLSDLTRLQTLYLADNQISNLTPLTGLTNISSLEIGRNEIEDLAPLSGLTKLQYINAGYNNISNLSPLASLKSLNRVDLSDNRITDVSPLAGLAAPTATPTPTPPTGTPTPTATPVPASALRYLDLCGNQISNLSGLSGLTGLENLYLSENLISDIAPLLSNTGLGSGDYITLYCNPLSSTSIGTYISELASRGASVSYTSVTSLPSPSQVSPTDTATGVGSTPRIKWGSVDNASTYNLQISTSQNFSTTVLNLTGISGISYKITAPLNMLTVYYWRVAAEACNGVTSNWSEAWQFTTLEYETIVTFPDPGLESAIRYDIEKPNADIYQSDLDDLTYLHGDYFNISDLSGLEHCTSLTELRLEENRISNISELSGLTKLTELYLDRNQISNIGPLSGLSNLSYLEIEENQINNVLPLAGLTSLLGLDIGDNQISNLSPLASLINLNWLRLYNNNIIDISPLASLINLYGLDLNGNQISDISPLSDLAIEPVTLTTFKLTSVATATPPPPTPTPTSAPVPSLQWLYLGNNSISDVSPLASLISLNCLYLNDNQISDLSTLDGLTALYELDLADNQIRDTSALSTLSELEYLYLENNQINNVEPLAELINLNWLNLNNNLISDIKPFVDDTDFGLEWCNLLLDCNPLSSESINTYIPQLEERNVWISYASNAIVTAPSLLSPIDGANGIGSKPTLQWSLVDGAASYNLQVSRQADFLTEVLNVSEIAENSYEVNTRLSPSTYYWRVESVSCNGATFESSTWSFTTRRQSGGGGSVVPATSSISLNLLGGSIDGVIDGDGVFQNDVDAASPDGKIRIHIAGGTKAFNEDGTPLNQLNVNTVSSYPAPSDGKIVVEAFDFQPNGVTFSPAIQITIKYDPATLPEGTDESQLVIAFYNAATGLWEYVTGTVNSDTNTITFSITHFTVFGVISPSGSGAAPVVTPTPTPTPTVVPTVTATSEVTIAPTPTSASTGTPAATHSSSDEDNHTSNWVWVIIAVVGGALLAALIGAIVKRNRKSS